MTIDYNRIPRNLELAIQGLGLNRDSIESGFSAPPSASFGQTVVDALDIAGKFQKYNLTRDVFRKYYESCQHVAKHIMMNQDNEGLSRREMNLLALQQSIMFTHAFYKTTQNPAHETIQQTPELDLWIPPDLANARFSKPSLNQWGHNKWDIAQHKVRSWLGVNQQLSEKDYDAVLRREQAVNIIKKKNPLDYILKD